MAAVAEPNKDTAAGAGTGGTGGTGGTMTLDPLCPQRMNFDMIDLMSYEIIMDRANRKERAGQLNVGRPSLLRENVLTWRYFLIFVHCLHVMCYRYSGIFIKLLLTLTIWPHMFETSAADRSNLT